MGPQASSCPNLNHRRSDAPVRCCPMCGAVVNRAIPVRRCTEQEHAASRRGRNKYCMHCNKQLIHGI
jgi:hypothetical protein